MRTGDSAPQIARTHAEKEQTQQRTEGQAQHDRELHLARIILREKPPGKTTLYISHETDLSQVRVDYHSPFGCNWYQGPYPELVPGDSIPLPQLWEAFLPVLVERRRIPRSSQLNSVPTVCYQ
jgi:hypothetical protein